MNIFKILASGDGRLKEPNVSAFLGYLLNPKADHGLNAEFLKAFLKPLLLKGDVKGWTVSSQLFDKAAKEVRDLSSLSRFDVDVYYEKAFKGLEGKNIVDIIIKISEKPKNTEDGRAIFMKNTPVALILVENKTQKNEPQNQIKNQYDAALGAINQLLNASNDMDLNTYKNELYTVLVTTASSNGKQWADFETDERRGYHITWTAPREDEHLDVIEENTTIDKIILQLIKREALGEIEPLQEYTKHTLKAFLNFIWSDFHSEKEEQRGGGKRTLHYANYESFEDFTSQSKKYKAMEAENKEWLEQLHSMIMDYLTNEFIEYSEVDLVNYTPGRIAYKFPGKEKIFHLHISSRNSIQVQYRLRDKFNDGDSNAVINGKESPYRFNFTCVPAQISTRTLFNLFKESYQFMKTY